MYPTRDLGPDLLPRRKEIVEMPTRHETRGHEPRISGRKTMRRKTLDALLTTGGFIVAAVLLVAGGLLLVASNFVQHNVHDQLADQKITMPSGKAIEDPAIKPYLSQYAGQEMTTGAQAKAYADHYIKVHMNKAGQGRTYEEVSGQFLALSND